MNYVITRNKVTCTCTKINHIRLYVEQVAKCRMSGAKHRFIFGSPQLKLNMRNHHLKPAYI